MKRRINAFTAIYVILISVIAASCMPGRKFQTPEQSIPESKLDEESTDEMLLADKEWYELYCDSHLQSLIGKAIVNNKDILIAAARITELAHTKRIDDAAFLPAVTLAPDADREWENYRGSNRTAGSQFDAKIAFSWEVDLSGRLRWGRKMGIAQYLESVEARRALQMSLVAQVAQSYFELVALHDELDIVRQTLLTREEGVRQAKLRFEGGLTDETPYRQAEVEFANAATLIPGLERQISAKQNEITLLCGDYPGPVITGDMRTAFTIPEYFTANISSDILTRRPDILAAEQSLRAAHSAMGMSYADRFPRLMLTGAYGFENDVISSLLKSPYGLIAGSLTGPLFSFNANRARFRARQAAYEQETARYEKTVLSVFHEASNAITGYHAAKETRERKSELERASSKNLELARLQYLNGVIRYLDLLDAQRSYFDAQLGLSNAIRDENIAVVNLYKALGGGW